MRPVLLQIGSFAILSYAVMLCLGACLSVWLCFREIDRRKLDRGTYGPLVIILFACGIIGARIMNCIVFYDFYKDKPLRTMLAFWEGGLAMYGGIFLAFACSYAYVRIKKISFWETADFLAPPWMLMLVLGRIGCFLNGCCYGKPTSSLAGFHLHSPGTGGRLLMATHPTQLYSAAAALIIFLIMWRVRLRPRFNGQAFLVFCLLYPVTRFTVEYFRADPRGVWRFFDLVALSESQLLSIPLLLFGVSAWFLLSRRQAVSSRQESSSCSAPASAGESTESAAMETTTGNKRSPSPVEASRNPLPGNNLRFRTCSRPS